jgi:hypothetical protein
VGERVKGRKGEWEKGRKGEGETRRVGEKKKGRRQVCPLQRCEEGKKVSGDSPERAKYL